jgi:hypothetical protein
LSKEFLHDLVTLKNNKYNFRYSNIAHIPTVKTQFQNTYIYISTNLKQSKKYENNLKLMHRSCSGMSCHSKNLLNFTVLFEFIVCMFRLIVCMSIFLYQIWKLTRTCIIIVWFFLTLNQLYCIVEIWKQLKHSSSTNII